MTGKTLEELDGEVWGEPTFDSYLVTTCHRLRKKPIDEFTVEDLRIMIGQDFSLPYLLPLAIEILNSDPLVSGDFFEGDLLLNVLRADQDLLLDHNDLIIRIRALAWKALPLVRAMDPDDETGSILLNVIESLTDEPAE